VKGDLATAVQLYNDVLGEVAAQMKNDEPEVVHPEQKRLRKHRKAPPFTDELGGSLPVAGEEKKDEEAPEEAPGNDEEEDAEEGEEEAPGHDEEEVEEEAPGHDEKKEEEL
jgi:hypothetical protein